MDGKLPGNAEAERLEAAHRDHVPWKKWGPYLSERQWGTVREDYSDTGCAWDYFPHDQARSRAYRWGEDGLGGFCDEQQRLCFALALWNGRDPILKERLFGLTNSEGNHGEDVKEYYYYLDSTPTHSFMSFLYKYPQSAFPYADLVHTNRARGKHDAEYELIDTGVFNEDRYFDVFLEYGKADPDDILIRITVYNRGPETATLYLLPTLWFRNTWSWTADGGPHPLLKEVASRGKTRTIAASHAELGDCFLRCEGTPELLFTENESNNARLFGTPNRTPYVKDGFDRYLVHGEASAVNPDHTGTKAAAHYELAVPAGGSAVVRLRLTEAALPEGSPTFGAEFDAAFDTLRQETDEFYASITPPGTSEDEALVMRQALAGMLWSKQYYYLDVDQWLDEHGANPLDPNPRPARNREWMHMINDDIISMPDKWEYPWYAAWDLAFHTVALSMVDADFAKHQLDLMLEGAYIHPSGQIPAYEWNFSDVNPPVHAWATFFVYELDKRARGTGDIQFLRDAFHKLLLNFTWWVNRKDRFGKNLFEGGFLGLDNIGVFDRSAPLPTGGYLEQADGTAWMAFFSQCMAQIAVELAAHDSGYEEMAAKFGEHFFWIAAAMNTKNGGLWDEEDGFYYDQLQLPDGTAFPMKVRSMVGLLPLGATTVMEAFQRERVPRALTSLLDRLERTQEVRASIHPTGPGQQGEAGRGIAALLTPERLRRILARMLDEEEFLSPYGIRALSRCHAGHPYVLNVHGQEYRVDYCPAESDSGAFGGNSNWRGPVWFPVNAILIRSLLQFYLYYGDDFRVECPTGSGKMLTLYEVAMEISRRLVSIFTRNERGRRPVFGGAAKFQEDPHWRDHLLFYEYFHGDNGAGIGASHQTGWTGLVAVLIRLRGVLNPAQLLAHGLLVGGRDAGQPAASGDEKAGAEGVKPAARKRSRAAKG
jgi:hypothetical protein